MSEIHSVPEQERIKSTSEIAERYARHPLATLETYKFFNQNSESAQQSKQEFIEDVIAGGNMVAPQFNYPDINVDTLLQNRDTLTELLSGFPIHRELTALERITRENIVNRLDEISIMILTKIQSELSPNDPDYERVSSQLGINMREVYGEPDKEHFRGILGYRMQKMADGMAVRDTIPEEVAKAWQFLQVRLPHDLPVERPYQMRPETHEWYKAQLDQRMKPAREAVATAIESGEVVLNNEGLLDADNLVKATNSALRARGFSDWSAELSDQANVDTTQAEKKIFIPRGYSKNLDYLDQVLLGHEIDQHVARRENGDESGIIELSGTGAHGYLAPEEGTGKVNEGLIKGKISNEASAFGFFISGGLALGFDNGSQGRNMRETCELVWRINFVADYLAGKSAGLKEDIRRSVTNTTTHLLRIYRGTDGRYPGVIFPKDSTTYYQGGVDVMKEWDHDMATMTDEERLFKHSVERSAKINPHRGDHYAIAANNLKRNPYLVR